MNVKWLREQLAQLNDDATVTIGVSNAIFEVQGVWTDSHDHATLPRVVLQLGEAYRYREAQR